MNAFLPDEQRAVRIISAVKSVSAQVGRSMAQVALAWLRHQTVPVMPIIGAPKCTNHVFRVKPLGESKVDSACFLQGFQLFRGQHKIQTGEIVMELR